MLMSALRRAGLFISSIGASSIGAAVMLACFMISPALSAELVMFEREGCVWCAVFNREVGPIYAKTREGARAPLRRVDIDRPIPSDLRFVAVERATPVFVLVDGAREIGRIRGYPGEDNFWGLLDGLVGRLDATKRPHNPKSPTRADLMNRADR